LASKILDEFGVETVSTNVLKIASALNFHENLIIKSAKLYSDLNKFGLVAMAGPNPDEVLKEILQSDLPDNIKDFIKQLPKHNIPFFWAKFKSSDKSLDAAQKIINMIFENDAKRKGKEESFKKRK
jgi:hypothetical protein